MKIFYTIVTTLLCSFTLVQAQEEKKEDIKPIPEAKAFVTSHQGTFGGKLIKYKAIAGETYLKNDDGEPVASIWSVTYKLDGPEDTNRPVTFVFNGGPGSASVWLHMGFFGPQVTKVDSDASADDGGAPYPLVNNNHGMLDLTDLVFIDPVGTGYSRVIGKGKTEDYWGLMEDARSIAAFMREWVTKNKRWNSPKYIAGESFGTTRAAAVNYELEGDGQEMSLNGLILISQALDYQGSTSTHDNIVSYVTYFPSMAATAWYHKKAGQGKTLEAFVEEARKFALDEYVSALYKGTRLTDAERSHIVDRMAYFTGLSKRYIEQADIRLLMPRFRKELLRDQGITIGQLDGRYKGDEYDDVADRATLGDPSSYNISGAYTAAINHYLSSQLKVEMDRPYLTSNGELGSKWRWRDVPDGRYWEPSYVNVARKLGDSMRRNKDLKVLVASGYYDLICPFFDAEYTFARNGILKDQVTLTYYEAGHMMYVHEPDLVKLATDIRKFLTSK
ncbi:MAG: peptidase S10 [Cyclobacteriaceae bacterium]